MSLAAVPSRWHQSRLHGVKSLRWSSGAILGALGTIWVVTAALLGILRPDSSQQGVTQVLIVGASAFTTVCVFLMLPRGIGAILSLALVERLGLLWLDLYTDYGVFSSGGDTEGFYSVALKIVGDPSLYSEDVYGSWYSKILAALFSVVGPSRLFAQYTNVLLGMVTLVLIYTSMQCLRLPRRASLTAMAVVSLMPIQASMSSILLRESLVSALVAASVTAFILWMVHPTPLRMVLVITFVSIAGTFHMGVFGLLPGYLLGFLFYDPASGKLSGHALAKPYVWIVTGLSGTYLITNSTTFFEKLRRVDSQEGLFNVAVGSGRGGSAYLPGLEVASLSDFVTVGWAKAAMLVVAPTPNYWRGLGDVISFLLDSTIYIAGVLLILLAFRMRKRATLRFLRTVLVTLTVAGMGAVFVLGVGTGTAGTAMRHRQKVQPVVAVAAAIALTMVEQRSREEPLARGQRRERDHDHEEIQ